MDKLITPEKVAEILDVSVHTLNRWRISKENDCPKLPFIKLKGHVKYSEDDVNKFIERSRKS